MVTVSVILFAIAAVGGLVLAARHKRPEGPPLPVALVHGIVAAAALVVLIVAVAQGLHSTLSITALVLFVIAALGGFVLFAAHLRKRAIPTRLVYVHGLAAVIAFVLLVSGAYFA